MKFIGDVHGKFIEYNKLLKNVDKSIQLGDMGLGFHGYLDDSFSEDMQHLFIRGNHDNPKTCSRKKNYLGDYGITEEGIFFVSGADSIDKHLRIEDKSWWRDEQLSYQDCSKVFELYMKLKPEIVISHDCPRCVIEKIYNRVLNNSMIQLFEQMFREHKPKKWIFAHHHKTIRMEIENVGIIGLDELEVFEL